jgi:hypothetical protein
VSSGFSLFGTSTARNRESGDFGAGTGRGASADRVVRLIIHSINDPLKRGEDYDEDMILYVQDWM